MSCIRLLATALAASLASAVAAQTGAPPSTAASPAADRPAADRLPAYTSALRDYRGFADAPVLPWREANDTVRRIGGWQVYAREASAAQRRDAPPSPPAGASPRPVETPPAGAGARP